MKTRLPPNVLFESANQKKVKDEYPIEEGDTTLGSYELKVIYDREKTGFED